MLTAFLRRRVERIACHGTKYEVPNKHEFWNRLFEAANARFYLVGRSNKSWIRKTTDQSSAFAASILRIVQGGGRVRILSDKAEEYVSDTTGFIGKFILAELEKLTPEQQSQMREHLQKRFMYSVFASSHYRAIVSDDRIVFIPSLNSHHFRDNALVFELTKQKAPFEFDAYMSDIDRLFDSESTAVPIDWSQTAASQGAAVRPSLS